MPASNPPTPDRSGSSETSADAHSEEASSESGAQPLGGFRIVSGLTLLSRVLGLTRDAAMAGVFGVGPILDAFTVAFRIPNLARRLFGEGALTAAFLPFFVRETTRNGDAVAWELGRRVLITLLLGLSALTLAGELLLGALHVGIDADGSIGLLLRLTAILLPYAVLICLAAQMAAMLHARQRFLVPALLPVVLNLIWIAALMFAAGQVMSPQRTAELLAWTILLAGGAQLLLAFLPLRRLGFRLRGGGFRPEASVRDVGSALLPVLLGLSVTQLNGLIDALLAWGLSTPEVARALHLPETFRLEPGTASALYLGQRLYQFPLGVFGVALGTVLYPRFSAAVESGDLGRFRTDLTTGLGLTIAVGVPASVGLVCLAEPVTDLLFRRGAFDARDAELTSAAVVAYASVVWAFCGLLIVQRGLYAVDDRTGPLKIGAWCAGLNVLLDILAVPLLGGVGLAWAAAVAVAAQFVWTARLLSRRSGGYDQASVRGSTFRTLLASGLMAAAVLASLSQLPSDHTSTMRLLRVAVPIATGIVVYFATARLLGIRVLLELLRR